VRVMSTQHHTLDGQYDPLISNSELLWFGGHWTETTHIGMFRRAPGVPLDLHYHDNDEYWFIFRGAFTAQVAGRDVSLRQGDLLATGMGNEHGISDPEEILEGVGFTPSMFGKKRLSHLIRERDGEPVPQRDA
jgi:mannose-6-phosphate isomerase-like protein (cupin superfamily)